MKFKMDKSFAYIMISFLLFLIGSCSATSSTLPSATPSGPRTIIVSDEAISEDDVGGFTSWYCKDFIREERIVVEVGFFGDIHWNMFGFILYDGGYTGDITMYQRSGLEHRWDWGPNSYYTIIIKTDGTGLYYDFSSVSPGESTKARDVYKCYQR